ADSCFSGQDAADQSWTNAACTYRIGEPCGVAADHVAISHEAIVLVSNGDLPASGKIAIIAQGRHLLETIISRQPILQQCAQRFLASLLLNTETDVHLVFALREQPEISSRSLLLVKVDIAVEGFDLDSIPEFRVQPRSWLNVILI